METFSSQQLSTEGVYSGENAVYIPDIVFSKNEEMKVGKGALKSEAKVSRVIHYAQRLTSGHNKVKTRQQEQCSVTFLRIFLWAK